MNISKALMHGSWDGWKPVALDSTGKTITPNAIEERFHSGSVPRHGGQVLVAFFVGTSGPFVQSDRFEGGEWDMRRRNPSVTIYAWREHVSAPKAQIVGRDTPIDELIDRSMSPEEGDKLRRNYWDRHYEENR